MGRPRVRGRILLAAGELLERVKKLEQDFRAGRVHFSRILMFHVLSYFLD